MSTTNELTQIVKERLAAHGAEFLPERTESIKGGEAVHGTINGTPARVEFTVTDEHPDYSHQVWVYTASGESLGRGNGARNYEDAIGIYQWQGVPLDLEEL